LARGAVTADDDVGLERLAGAEGFAWRVAYNLVVFVADPGVDDGRSRQDGAGERNSLHVFVRSNEEGCR
jgi:hypothetical protein